MSPLPGAVADACMNGAELSRAKAAVELGSITDLCGSGGAGGCCRGVPKLGSSGGGSAAKGGEADETVGCLWGQGRRGDGKREGFVCSVCGRAGGGAYL